MAASSKQMLVLSLIPLAALTQGAVAEEADVEGIVAALAEARDAAEANRALGRTREILEEAPSDVAPLMRKALCRRLETADSPAVIKRISLALSAGPSDDAVRALLSTFTPDAPDYDQVAVCVALRTLVREHPLRDPQAERSAIRHLEGVVRSGSFSRRVVDTALLAAAAYGQTGCDLLLELANDPATSSTVGNILYTALGRTGDPRALPILRSCVDDQRTPSGKRIQALSAIGQLFAAAARSRLNIDPGEREACLRLLRGHLGDEAPDELFAVALDSLARTATAEQLSDLREVAVNDLSTTSDLRRQAAMRFLYTSGVTVEGQVLAIAQAASVSDSCPLVRDLARAIVDKGEANTRARR